MTGIDGGRLVGTPGGAEHVAADAPGPGSGTEPAFRSGTEPDFRSGTEPALVRGYAWSLFAIATVAAVTVAVSNGAFTGFRGAAPVFLPVLLLGAVIALSFNQLAFFPSEWSATAEAAVLVAAVVGFAGYHDGADLLGPAAVAFLCGPLDLVHWRQRVFWRMAYNSGNRMIAALVAASAYHAVGDTPVQPALRLALAALAASLVFAFVDLFIFVGIERLRGQSVRAAVREDLLIDCLTVPLGLFGGVAGYVAVQAGWWAGALVLVPAVFAPELVLVRGRRAVRRRTAATRALRVGLPIVASGAAVVGAVLALAPLPAPSALVGLVVVAVVVGFEVQVDTRAPVPGSGLAALVVAAMVVGGHGALAAAIVVAVTASATAWVLVQRNAWWVPPLAGGAALASAVVFDARPTHAGALAAALVFEVVLATRSPRILWTAPLVCTAAALADVWRQFDARGVPLGHEFGVVVFGSGLLAIAAVAALWGAPPWSSRVLGPWGARRPARAHRIVVLTTAALSLGLGVAAASTVSARGLLVAGAGAAAGAVATMVMVGVRQWRFAPRGRARDAACVLVSVVAVATVYPAAAFEGSGWSLVVLIAALGTCIAIGWPIALRADASARLLDAPRRADTPVR